ncbi:MAG: hypothetical protein ACKVT0_21655 [Planctomycetaceae bacterium]
MSARSSKKSSGPPPADAPAIDVYVGLLFAAVAATCVAITFLVLELDKYDWAMAS